VVVSHRTPAPDKKAQGNIGRAMRPGQVPRAKLRGPNCAGQIAWCSIRFV